MRQCREPISAERLSVAGILGLTPASLLDRGGFVETLRKVPCAYSCSNRAEIFSHCFFTTFGVPVRSARRSLSGSRNEGALLAARPAWSRIKASSFSKDCCLRVVAMRGFINVDCSHVRKVDCNGPFFSRRHNLKCFYHMLKPPVDFLVFFRRVG